MASVTLGRIKEFDSSPGRVASVCGEAGAFLCS